MPRFPERLELDVEDGARLREPLHCVAKPGARGCGPVEMRLDARRDLRDTRRLGGQCCARPLQLPPKRDPTQDRVREPSENAGEEDKERKPKEHGAVLP